MLSGHFYAQAVLPLINDRLFARNVPPRVGLSPVLLFPHIGPAGFELAMITLKKVLLQIPMFEIICFRR